MNKLISVVLLIVAVLVIPMVSFAYTINDPINNVYTWPSTHPETFDRIGGPIYELYGMDISRALGKTTFDIYTNFPQGGDPVGSWTTLPADLAIDLNQDGAYELGIAFRSQNGIVSGGVYSNPTWLMSQNFDPSLGHSYPTPGAGYVYHEGEIVTIAGSATHVIQPVGYADILSWIQNDTNVNNNTPDWKIHLVLSDTLLSGDTKFDVFYGGATCANDFLGGTSPQDLVPEPATMSMLGMGLLGLFGIRRKQIKS